VMSLIDAVKMLASQRQFRLSAGIADRPIHFMDKKTTGLRFRINSYPWNAGELDYSS
jgi:hypothetical protein